MIIIPYYNNKFYNVRMRYYQSNAEHVVQVGFTDGSDG